MNKPMITRNTDDETCPYCDRHIPEIWESFRLVETGHTTTLECPWCEKELVGYEEVTYTYHLSWTWHLTANTAAGGESDVI